MRTCWRCLLWACSMLAASGAWAQDVAWQTDGQLAWDASRAAGIPIVVFITRDHCRYCVEMKVKTWTHPQVESQLEQHFTALAIDAGEHPEYVSSFQVSKYPTTLIIAPDKTVLDRIEGFLPGSAMHQRLSAVHVRYAQQGPATQRR